MIGNNVLELCNAEMAQAVEHYLNEVQFKVPVKVISVKACGGITGGFKVTLGPASPIEPKGFSAEVPS